MNILPTFPAMNCMKTSSATMVVCGFGPGRSSLLIPNLGRFFLRATACKL